MLFSSLSLGLSQVPFLFCCCRYAQDAIKPALTGISVYLKCTGVFAFEDSVVLDTRRGDGRRLNGT